MIIQAQLKRGANLHTKKKCRKKRLSSFSPKNRRRKKLSSTPSQVSQSSLQPLGNSSLVAPLLVATHTQQIQQPLSTPTRMSTRSHVPSTPELGEEEEAEESLIVRRMLDYEKQNRMRICISFIYESLHHQSYIDGDQGLYRDPDTFTVGIISTIAKTLKLDRTHYKTLKKVVLDTIVCVKDGIPYEPFRKVADKSKGRKINPSSLDMHLLSKLKQNGSFRITHGIFNACIRAPMGLPPLGYTAIYNSIQNSNCKVVRTIKTNQQSDRNIIWKQARFQSLSQLVVRFGHEFPQGNTSGAKLMDEKYISKEKIEEKDLGLVIQQMGFWDEKHIEQVCGEHRDFTYQFGYDENGVYNEQVEAEVFQKVSRLYKHRFI